MGSPHWVFDRCHDVYRLFNDIIINKTSLHYKDGLYCTDEMQSPSEVQKPQEVKPLRLRESSIGSP